MTTATRSFLDFGGRWIVVTGASSGLGRACAVELAAHGAQLVLVGRNTARLAETSGLLAGSGHQSLCLDLADLNRVAPELSQIAARVGRIYGLCHAAGTMVTSPLSTTTVDVLQSMMTVNVLAGMELARTIARRDVMDPEGGSLLFVSSVYGNAGVAGAVGYSATKGAITAAVRAMAVELARRRIRVNTISPGLIRSPMTEAAFGELSHDQVAAVERRHLLGPGSPVDVARAAVFMLAPATAWITGIDLAVDGGYSAQ